jgi:hypothetical protein
VTVIAHRQWPLQVARQGRESGEVVQPRGIVEIGQTDGF